MAAKKKPALTPEAAKILEQYRNAGAKTGANNSGVPAAGEEGSVNLAKPSAPPPTSTHRSGTRGK